MKIITVCLATVLLISMAGAQTGSTPEPKEQSQAPEKAAPENAKSPDTAKQDGDTGWRKFRVKLSDINVSGAYSHFSGPVVSPLWPWGFYPYSFYPYGFAYSGMFFDPFYGPHYPGYFSGFRYGADKGHVKLSSEPKDSAVYVDGAYAGTADHLKNIWLDPGAYDLSVSAPDRTTFTQRIYVLSGKEIRIKARLDPQTTEQKPKEEKKEEDKR